MLFNATFYHISVISWRQFYRLKKPEYPEKTTNLSQVTVVSSAPHSVSGNRY